LKLANILIDERKRPALADFGIAHLRDATRLTVTGHIAGTPLYMSPEQARGISDIDHRSDLYSFAVLAYLMSTGFHPFTGAVPLAIMHQHLSAQAPLPSEINPNLSHKVDAVLLRGLAKDRAARPDSSTEFANDLAEAISGGDIGR
jgi:serine/threonine-protein kinase